MGRKISNGAQEEQLELRGDSSKREGLRQRHVKPKAKPLSRQEEYRMKLQQELSKGIDMDFEVSEASSKSREHPMRGEEEIKQHYKNLIKKTNEKKLLHNEGAESGGTKGQGTGGTGGTGGTSGKGSEKSKQDDTVDEQEEIQEQKKPFGASKNIHTLDTIGPRSSRKTKPLGGKIYGFEN